MIFRPRIVAFMCHWSLPPEIDVSTPSLIRGYPKIRIVKTMCAGRIDPAIVMETFLKGADGVLVVGCHTPDCHYIDGNTQAERKVKMLKRLIRLTGFDAERLRLEWANASEIENLARIINHFRNQVASLGASPLTSGESNSDVVINMKAARAVAENFTLRLLVGREKEMTVNANVYGDKVSQEEFDRLLEDTLEAEFIRHKIHQLTTEKPMSVKEIAAATRMEPSQTLCHIVNMRRKNMITLDCVKGTTPLYKALEVH
ncbi:MAG: hydrogenase iron-sulfur subunit [Candidatus Bathyarchaeia archaeon]